MADWSSSDSSLPCSSAPYAAKPKRRPRVRSSATSPAALAPKVKLSPTITAAACSRSTRTSCTNSSGGSRGKLEGERQHREDVHTEGLDEFGLAAQRGQLRGMTAGTQHFGRVRVEGEQNAGQAALGGQVHHPADQFLVPAVHAVEHADGDHASPPAAGKSPQPTPPQHAIRPRLPDFTLAGQHHP